jgi:hypothetical protein
MFEIVPIEKLYTLTWMLSTLLWNNWIILLCEVNLSLWVVLKRGVVAAASYEARKFGVKVL